MSSGYLSMSCSISAFLVRTASSLALAALMEASATAWFLTSSIWAELRLAALESTTALTSRARSFWSWLSCCWEAMTDG